MFNTLFIGFQEKFMHGLQVIGKENLSLKDKQREVLRILAVEKKDVLPTAYGKSLIYQALAPLMVYIVAGGHPTENKSVVLVVSPKCVNGIFLEFQNLHFQT